jgi:DNA-binding CsgD family transcriptional regulator/Tfp pilus assembly protein PilF
VGVATLSLLTSAAEEGLVLCVVDDAHWLDAASAAALLFCARRLGADRVAMAFGARDGAAAAFEAPGLTELTLTGLDTEQSRELLAQRLGSKPADAVVQRLISETGGNPLALLELPGELTAAQLEGAVALPGALHLTARVEGALLDRSRRLPRSAQQVLLLAAADDTGLPEVLRAAGAASGWTEEALQQVFDSGLLTDVGGQLAFRHPLVRSAIYQAATDVDRRAAHRALASVLTALGHQDRAVWHRAYAADGPDESVAAELEDVGSRAQRRGGHVAALAAYERAAALTSDVRRRTDRDFAAARSAWACGQAQRALDLLHEARAATEDPVVQCDLARLRGHIEVNIGSAAEAHRIFVEAAHSVLPVDPVRALDISAAAAVMRTFGADSGTPLRTEELLAATAADASPRTRCLGHMLVAMTLAADGEWADAVSALDLALEIGEVVDDRDVLWNLGNAALQLGDDQRQHEFYGYALSRAREAGAVTAVIYCLQRLAFGHWSAADHLSLRVTAEEALTLGSSIGQPAVTALPLAWLTLLAALQDRNDYDDLLARLQDVTGSQHLGIMTDPVRDLVRWAMGVRAANTGDMAGALHHLGRLRMPVFQRLAAPDRVEAAVRAGELETARSWTDDLATFADATRRPWALASVAYARALTETDAEPFFEQALAQGAASGRLLDVARVELAYGEWLRRRQQRVEARVHLRRALETFQDVRAEALVSRAEQELRASGETARKRDPSTLLQLTPTELKIAQLVSSGMSNKDVAAQCWISPRTVAFHLRNVFAKAGVTSRGELVRLDLA